eukprot:CAMPEP_0172420070 /NCGR_PEP_ID=MMETSP1064-20121228/6460_1 /TAXON_ID=202472 /ORGANISM="Aulacoseira subarctica , Strain CCAP 1002/5" /LENGTH=414 /DNA_ID=CAMNT_0013159841 /DNA_START=103 /DNA_END=1347 /DNA_ORIENTATION=-
MGKKGRTLSGMQKAASRKVDKSTFPEPPLPVEEEIGSAKILDQPSLEGPAYKVLGKPGYDDGGVADLSLLIDLNDSVARRRRGETEYFSALKANRLPRASVGAMATMSRRDQKVQLAQLLFSDDDGGDDKTPSEVYSDQNLGDDDPAAIEVRKERLSQARAALRLSMLLGEPASAAVSLVEICKRNLLLKGKSGAEDSMRCVNKALEIAGEGFWDGDDILLESQDEYKVPAKFEKNATTPGLSHPTQLKYVPVRVSHLCLRSALLQKANVFAALGQEEDARAGYELVLPLIENEPRCSRIDWEVVSLRINIGNTYARSGDYESADEQYKLAEMIGMDHLTHEDGSRKDGKWMVNSAKKARAIALAKNGKKEEARVIIQDLIEQKINEMKETEKEKMEGKKSAVENNGGNPIAVT